MNMRPKTVIGLVLMVGFTTLLFMNFGEQVGGYMNFSEAEASGAKAHVVGQWVEDRSYHYNRGQNVFRFYMKDDKGMVREVRYPNPKPANFEEADKLVVEGHTKDGVFVAEHILVKCPSKYNKAGELKTTSAP